MSSKLFRILRLFLIQYDFNENQKNDFFQSEFGGSKCIAGTPLHCKGVGVTRFRKGYI